MKKQIVLLTICCGMAVAAQQFVIKKNKSKPSAKNAINSKQLIADGVAIEQQVPVLLHGVARLLECMHEQIAICVDGNNSLVKDLKKQNRVELYEKKIVEVTEAMNLLIQKSDELCDIVNTTCQKA